MDTELQYHWKILFEHSSNAMIIIDADTSIILDANPSSEKLLGYPTNFLKKSKFSDFIVGDGSEEWNYFINLTQSSISKSLTLKIINHKHNIYTTKIKGFPFSAHKACCAIIIFIEPLQSDSEYLISLKKKLRFYETILMQMPTEFAVLNAKWQYLFINRNSIKDETLRKWMIGKTDYDFCRYRYKDFSLADNRTKQYKELERTKTGKEWIDEHPLPDGSTKYVLRKLYPYFVDGKLEMNFGFGIDVTELIKNEREIKRIMSEMSQQNEELKQFSYITTHDLKEPLRNIISFSNLLERRYKGKLNKEADEFLHFITGNARRMNNLLNALKSYVTLDKMEDYMEIVDMNKLCEMAISNLQLLIEEQQANIKIEQLPPVFGHRAYLIQLLQNLINNAIKFCEHAPHITISGEVLDGCCRYHIKDNGIGIPLDFQEKVFKIFNRLEKRKYQGTGMGLAISRKIVQLHYGTIWVESDGKNGSTFIFELKKHETVDLVTV